MKTTTTAFVETKLTDYDKVLLRHAYILASKGWQIVLSPKYVTMFHHYLVKWKEDFLRDFGMKKYKLMQKVK